MNLRITLNSYMLSSGAILQAARGAFGDKFVDTYRHYNGDVILVVTAEQLVKFQILRDEAGAQNLWQALKVREVNAAPRSVTVDVRPCGCR